MHKQEDNIKTDLQNNKCVKDVDLVHYMWDIDRKQLESFEIWCWRRIEKISWTDHVRNEVF
jgi:hypothetical protein